MTDNGSRASRGWAIGVAFVGQVGIFASIGALLAGAATAPVAMSVSAVPAPPAVSVQLPVFAAPGISQPNTFHYTFSLHGKAGGGTVSGVYPERQSPLPAFLVTPGKQVDIKLGVTITGSVELTGLTVSFAEVTPDLQHPMPIDQMLYQDAAQPLAPARYTFAVDWPGSGGGMQPGTRWLIYLSADSPEVSDGSPIATVTIAP